MGYNIMNSWYQYAIYRQLKSFADLSKIYFGKTIFRKFAHVLWRIGICITYTYCYVFFLQCKILLIVLPVCSIVYRMLKLQIYRTTPTFLTAYSLLAWIIVKTNPFPPFPILLSVAFLVGNGYFMLPLNIPSHYKN